MAGRPETPLDPAAGPIARLAYELRKLRVQAGSPTYRQMAARTGAGASTLSQAAAGERLPTLATVLAYAQACGADPAQWEARWREAAAEEAAEPREQAGAHAPYRGLARFEPGDADTFFGREQLTGRLLALARSRRFTAVCGPSGSGKSSLLRAGLIPLLRLPAADGPSPAAVRILTPGRNPVRAHGQRLIAKDAEDPADSGDSGDAGDATGDTWLIVDQFEEIYTLCADPAERGDFLDRLLACTHPGSRLRVIIALRADFLGRCAEHPELTSALQDGTVLVGPMSRDELREAIVKPAQRSGLIVERALTARLLEEVEGEPGALPLMSHALLETWHRRKGRTLTEAAYEAAGGLQGAIARTAEDVFTAMSPEQADLTRAVLLRLIAPGDGKPDTRRPVDRSELDFADEANTGAVLDKLAGARLLTLDGDTVDLAHEALIAAWPRLQAWINDAREQLRLHRRLTQDAHLWDQMGRDPGTLYRGTRLSAAQEAFAAPHGAPNLTALEQDFLHAGTDLQRQERRSAARAVRRQRSFAASLSLLAVLALLAGVIAWQQNTARNRQQTQTAARRAATVAQRLRSSDPVTAMRLSVAAWTLSRTPETRAAVLEAAAQRERESFTLPRDDGAQDSLSPDGHWLTRVSERSITVWDLRTHRITGTYRPPVPDMSMLGEVSPDGRVMVVSDGSWTRLWDVRAQHYRGPAFGPPARTQSSLTGTYGSAEQAATYQVGDTIEVWDTQRRQRLLSRPYPEGKVYDVSPDTRLLALCTGHGIEVWNTRTGREADTNWRTGSSCDGSQLEFTPDGTALALVDRHGVRRVRVTDGRELPALEQLAPQGCVFSDDGKYAVTIGASDLLVWRLDSPDVPVYRYTVSAGAPDDVQFDPAFNALRYTTTDPAGRLIVRTLDLGGSLSPSWNPAAAEAAVFSADGSTLALLRNRGHDRLFTLLDGYRGSPRDEVPGRHRAAADDDTEPPMSLSADGHLFAYGAGVSEEDDQDRTVRLWDTRGHRPSGRVPTGAWQDGPGSMFLSPDGRRLVTLDDTGDRISQWDTRSGGRLRTVPIGPPSSDPESQPSAAISPVGDGGRLLVTDTSTLVSLTTGKSAHIGMETCDVCPVAAAPDGSRVAEIDGDRVTLWDAQLRTSLGVLTDGRSQDLPGGGEQPSALAFSPDGSTLAVGGSHGTLQLWDVASQQLLDSGLPTPGDKILSLAFSKDGGTLYAAGEHVAWQKYDIDAARAVAGLCRRAGGSLSRADWHTYLPDVPYHETCAPS